jgi:hypothetical protein
MGEILVFWKEYDNSLRSVAIDGLGLLSMQLVTDAKVDCRPWYTVRYVRLFRVVQCFRAFFKETEPILITLRIDDSSHSRSNGVDESAYPKRVSISFKFNTSGLTL